MSKISVRILALAAVGFALSAPTPSRAASAYDHVAPTNWSRAYVLTPLEHKRLRAWGLKDMEVFLLANAATQSGHDVDDLLPLYFIHLPPSDIVEYLKIDLRDLTKMHPEWTTPEWQEAVQRGDYTWIPPQSPTGEKPQRQ